jgi:hypothetical protein
MQQASTAAEPAATPRSVAPAATAPAPLGTTEMVPERPLAPIPYRKEGSGADGSLIGVLAVTVLMLAVFVVLLRLAKSRGLLDRWIVSGPAGSAANKAGHDAMRVEQALRVSPRTMLYRIRDGERRYLLVESIAANARLQPLRDGDGAPSLDDGHDDEQ